MVYNNLMMDEFNDNVVTHFRKMHQARIQRRKWRNLWLLIAFMVFVGGIITHAITKPEEIQEYSTSMPTPKPTPTDEFVTYLAGCESDHTPHICIIDTNGLESCGMYQFQFPIMRDYALKVMGVSLTYAEYTEWAKDPNKSRKIAKHIIEDDFQGGKYNWANCYHKYVALKL